MGNYSVPPEIRKLKPKGTMVKIISGGYYVYDYENVKDENGKHKLHMGHCIGSIVSGIGFVPNSGFTNQTNITTVEFGQYAIAMSSSKTVLEDLKAFFNPEEAVRMYTIGLIFFVNGYTPMKDISKYFEQSFLSVIYPTLKLGESVVSDLYDNLGRRQTYVIDFQNYLIKRSSGVIATDGHVIGCCSDENDLAQNGYKFAELGESQLNLLMMYDVVNDAPLAAGIFPGKTPDKVSVRDFLARYELHDILFLVDRGFYSAQNLELYTRNGNSYIIPLGANLSAYKTATENLAMSESFLYQKGNKRRKIEYKEQVIEDHRVLVYRDVDEALDTEKSYLSKMKKGMKGYTQEGYEEHRKYWGVAVLQTSRADSPEEVYLLYKKRWSIEVFYRYLKNEVDFKALGTQSYYKTQGLAFIMLISSLIESEVKRAVKGKLDMSADDCLLDSRMLKATYDNKEWQVRNQQANVVKIFETLGASLNVENGYTT